MSKLITILALALAVGCGGKTAAAPAHDEHAEHHEGEEHHAHGADGSPIAAFHEVLAPLWHAEDGPKRVTDTCNASEQFHALATNIVSAGAPATAAPDYLDAATGLLAAVDELAAECTTPEREDFSAKFAAVHAAFHMVAEKSGAE